MLNELNQGNKVCALKKALYGLRQSGRQWFKKLDETLVKLGFKASDYYPCLYIKKEKGEFMFLGIYVDDLILVSNTQFN